MRQPGCSCTALLSRAPCAQVVQHFTELALEIRSARISSDGGWFVDSFEIQEADGTQVTNKRKLESIRRVRTGHVS